MEIVQTLKEIGFVTLISPYLELFIRGESPGRKCPDTILIMSCISFSQKSGGSVWTTH